MSVADAFNQLREEAKTSSTLDAMFRCDAQFRLFGQHFLGKAVRLQNHHDVTVDWHSA